MESQKHLHDSLEVSLLSLMMRCLSSPGWRRASAVRLFRSLGLSVRTCPEPSHTSDAVTRTAPYPGRQQAQAELEPGTPSFLSAAISSRVSRTASVRDEGSCR